MGERVWQVQKELEQLQARSHGAAEVPHTSDHVMEPRTVNVELFK